MDALTLLTTRQSCPRLEAPAPDAEKLQTILNAAVRVPDHGALDPWEFIIAEGEGLERLGEIFVAAAKAAGADEGLISKAAAMPKRAPMVITVVARTQAHPKVPVLEQQIAAGCAVMAMQQAAFALGLGGIWRTGDFAFDREVHRLLKLKDTDQIVGFLYLGTPAVNAPIKPAKDGRQFARYL
ncbi:NAD(P)H nitroreductase [Shewanella sp. JM162201]|uniref:Putative NAD(P)H nitroreductase n=1 Tax=Shewanella jiangmenensis TaxID=2837387 RepID=A0ABS5V002_9GAMM|nr:NAD(P)H nitroreductase [Shewanella jiangmenensis]MBT1442936.1 NAD(P)H nitroreductase [Shewanella jiangmenensis]